MNAIKESRSEKGYAVIELQGQLDFDGANSLDKEIAKLAEQGHKHIILEMSAVTAIFSSAVGMIVKHFQKQKKVKGSLPIVGAREVPMEVFALLGFVKNKFLQFYQTVEEAKQSFS